MDNTKKQILPIGSVILLEEGTAPLLIIGRGSLYKKDDKVGYLDYSAVIYPIGMGMDDEDQFIFFNHEDIKSILFTGYITAEEQQFAWNYQELSSECGYEKLQLKKQS